MFSFGEVGKECHVKTVLRVHDPVFYWKVNSAILFSFPHVKECLVMHIYCTPHNYSM